MNLPIATWFCSFFIDLILIFGLQTFITPATTTPIPNVRKSAYIFGVEDESYIEFNVMKGKLDTK